MLRIIMPAQVGPSACCTRCCAGVRAPGSHSEGPFVGHVVMGNGASASCGAACTQQRTVRR